MSKTPEAKLKVSFMKAVKNINAMNWHTPGTIYSRRGLPDYFFFGNGVLTAVECKKSLAGSSHGLSPSQAAVLAELQSRGAICMVCAPENLTQVVDKLKEIYGEVK